MTTFSDRGRQQLCSREKEKAGRRLLSRRNIRTKLAEGTGKLGMEGQGEGRGRQGPFSPANEGVEWRTREK